MLRNTGVAPNTMLAINSFRNKIFPDNSLTFGQFPDSSRTSPGFPDKWSSCSVPQQHLWSRAASNLVYFKLSTYVTWRTENVCKIRFLRINRECWRCQSPAAELVRSRMIFGVYSAAAVKWQSGINKYERYYGPRRCPLAYLLYYVPTVSPACA